MHIKTLIAALLIGSPLIAAAVDEHHPEQTPATEAPASSPAVPMQDQAMAEQLKKMQAVHDRIAAAKTPAERQAAMLEGMASMREGLTMMQNNCKGMGMGMGMGGGKDGTGMGMMDMMMKMMDQQSSMMKTMP